MENGAHVTPNAGGPPYAQVSQKRVCYRCGKPGHIARFAEHTLEDVQQTPCTR